MRTFIAAGITEPVRKEILKIQSALASLSLDAKWVEKENIHITLKFLGEVADKDIMGVISAVRDACAAEDSFYVHISSVGVFPDMKRPRVIWVGVSDGADEIRKLSGEIESSLVPLGFEKERREFSPHLTIGRVRSLRNTEKLGEGIGKIAHTDCGRMILDEVLIMRSDLTGQGPVYSVLERAGLR